MSNEVQSPGLDASGAAVASLFRTAADLTTNTARWGLRLASLPVLPLPSIMRNGFLESTRLTLETLRIFPEATAHALKLLADDVDELEARSARREDLGRRLRRDERRRLREGS